MEKEFVTYSISLAVKELGFDEECFGWYWFKQVNTIQYSRCSAKHCVDIPAPLWQQVINWFREKDIIIIIDIWNNSNENWYYKIYNKGILEPWVFEEKQSFEKIREKSILEAIKLYKH